jgi:hypothetical protein
VVYTVGGVFGTTTKERQTKKLAGQIFDAWIARKHSGLYSVDEAAEMTCAEFGIPRSDFSEAIRVACRSAS